MASLRRNEARFAESLARLATNDPTLTHVDFDHWGIGDEGAGRLVMALRGNTVVTHLWLGDNGISAALVRALVDVLESSTTLEALDLEGSSFGDLGARASARLLRTSSLEALNLSNCGIGVDGARALVEAVPSNSSLTTLWLKGNNLGDANTVSRLLPGNSTLTRLNLMENGISDVGARALAEAIPNNASLTDLYMGGNSISGVGALLLARALLINSSVDLLNLVRNDISDELRRLVDDLTQINTNATNPQEALELKVAWLRNLDEGGLRLLGFEESGVEEDIRRLQVVCRVIWLISSGLDGDKEDAVITVLDQLEHFMRAEQRRGLFRQLLASPERGPDVAASMDVATARTLYRYGADCGAAPVVLMHLIRAHPSLCACRDVRHGLFPFMLLATMAEAGVGDVLELLLLNPNLVEGGIEDPDLLNISYDKC